MKKQLLFLIFCTSLQVFSQDLLITQGGDSLKVKILEETAGFIFYQTKNAFGKSIQQRIYKSMISDFKYNFYTLSEADSRIFEEQARDLGAGGDFKYFMKFRTGFDVGYFRTSNYLSSENDFQNYLNQFRNGGIFVAHSSYYLFEKIGFGFRYQRIGKSKNQSNAEFITANGQTQIGNIRDNLAIHSFSPMVSLRYPINFKNYIYLNLHGGIGFYRNNALRTQKELILSRSFPFGVDLSLDNLQGNSVIGYDSGLSVSLHYSYVKYNNFIDKNEIPVSTSFYPDLINPYGMTVGIKLFKIPKYLKLTSY